MRTSLLLSTLGFVLGCGTEPVLLAVDVRSDLRAGDEAASVRVDAEACGGGVAENALAAGDPLLDGIRVLEVELEPPLDCRLDVSLLDAAGQLTLRREVLLQFREAVVVTVILSRDCRGVSCPLPDGAAALSACVGGRCEDPRCTPETPDACVAEPECETVADCAAASGCLAMACVGGSCLGQPDDDRCGEGEVCEAEEGCVPAAVRTGRRCASSAWCCERDLTVTGSALRTEVEDYPMAVAWREAPALTEQLPTSPETVSFTTDDGIELPSELEAILPDGTLLAWVRLPRLATESAMPLTARIGPGCDPSAAPAGLWDGFQEVWHLSEELSGAESEVASATEAGATGAGGSGAPDAVPVRAPALLGFGQVFDGVDDHIRFDGGQVPRTAGSLSHWILPTTTEPIIAYYETSLTSGDLDGFGSGADALEFHTATTEAEPHLVFQEAPGIAFEFRVAPGRLDAWTHVAVTWRIPGDVIIYVDGEEKQRRTVSEGLFLERETVYRALGRPGVTSRTWEGAIDELRVADAPISPAHVDADARLQRDPAAHVGAGELTVRPASR